MPRILINERDKTSPGTPDSYANYAVLLVGFKNSAITDGEIEPDSNGVYEFNSKSDFKSTIGLVSSIDNNGNRHLGNQMAYELLNLGYTVLYKPISDVMELTNEDFWEVFKDKANYDFRFVSHGLIGSTDLTSHSGYLNYTKQRDEAFHALEKLYTLAGKSLKTGTDGKVNQVTESILTEEAYDEFRRSEEAKSLPGLIDPDTKEIYLTFAIAYPSIVSIHNMAVDNLKDLDAATLDEKSFNEINGNIANLAHYLADVDNTGRGDCVALIEVDETKYKNSIDKPENAIIDAVNTMTQITESNGKYCAATVPSVSYQMDVEDEFDDNKTFPGAFHYLACFINSLRSGFAEWYAAAGYTRGTSSYIVAKTSVKLGEIAINALEPRNTTFKMDDNGNPMEGCGPKFSCNVVANFRGSYYLWGNRTAHELGQKVDGDDLVASHFLNIRQLCTTIKKQLYVACRRFTFDPNSDALWVNFTNAIKPTLELMKADQGIRDYKIAKVTTDKKATLKAKIRIIPIEAVEDFDLEVSLEDSFGETAAVVNE